MALVVVSYDIANDRRRARLHALLSRFGVPVQESLFECELDDARHRALLRALKRAAHRDDTIRVYPLCAACEARIISVSGESHSPQPAVYLD